MSDELTRLRAVQREALLRAAEATCDAERMWHWLGLADYATEELYLEDEEWGRKN